MIAQALGPQFQSWLGGQSFRKDSIVDEIKGVARARIRAGKLEEYKRLCEEAMEIVRTRDTGTLQYEIFFNDDESEAVVFERYRDIDAALEHFANVSHLMGPLAETATVTGEVLGKPSPKMHLGEGGPNLYTPWAVFHGSDTQT